MNIFEEKTDSELLSYFSDYQKLCSLDKYEEALQFLKQHSPDGKLPTMKDLRSEKELLVQQKSAQYETYQYFKDYHRELQTVCSNVENILNQPSVQKHATREFTL